VPAPARDVPVPVRVVADRTQRLQTLKLLKSSQSLETLTPRAIYMSDSIFKTAPYNPPHLFVSDTLYMLTASIYGKAHLMKSPERRPEWQDAFQEAARIYQWQIIAWVVLPNHYHTIVRSPEQAATLSKFINSYHKFTARNWNQDDGMNGRKVWWNYWDRCIRCEDDYYSGLRYVFWNPVKHGLVERPEDYEFSNYRDFLNTGADYTEIGEVNDVPEF
jgi:putative transposase